MPKTARPDASRTLPRPHVPAPPIAMVAPALAAIGLPPPRRIEVLAPAWVHANYRMAFDGDLPDLLLRRVLTQPGYSTLDNELAALTLARTMPDLPVVQRYRRLPPGMLPWDAAVSDLLPGVTGARVLRQLPALGPAVARRVGRLVRTLGNHPLPAWGLVGDGGRFAPRRRSWSDEWKAAFAQHDGYARGRCGDLGPISDALVTAARDRFHWLDAADTWCLVHGDLHPSNLLFGAPPTGGGEPPLTGLVDWEGATVGDPLTEWALLLELPPETIGYIAQGYGVDTVRAWLDDRSALGRLELYYLTRCVRRLSFAAYDLFRGHAGDRRCWALEYGRHLAVEALEPGLVEARLRRALEVAGTGPVAAFLPSDPINRATWRLIEAPKHVPHLGRGAALVLLGALCATRLAEAASAREQRDPWLELAHAWAERLGPQLDAVPAEPIPDRAAWLAEVTGALAHNGIALAVWWALLEGAVRLAAGSTDPARWPLNDAALRGFESVVTALGSWEDTRPEPTDPPQRIVRGLLVAAAWSRLGGLTGVERPEVDENALSEAWEDHTLFGRVRDGEVDVVGLQRDLVQARAPRGEADVFAPVVLLALSIVPAALPVTPGRVLQVLGIGAAPEPVAEPEVAPEATPASGSLLEAAAGLSDAGLLAPLPAEEGSDPFGGAG